MTHHRKKRSYNRKIQQELNELRRRQKAAENPMTVKRVNGVIANLKQRIKHGYAQLAIEEKTLEQLCTAFGTPVQKAVELRQSIATKEAQLRESAQQRIRNAKKRVETIIEEDAKRKGFFQKLLSDKTLSPEAQILVAEQQKIINETVALLASRVINEQENCFCIAYNIVNNLRHAIKLWESSLPRHEELKSKLKLEDEARFGKDKAMIAAYLDKTRERAETIKDVLFVEQLKKFPHCPYCGGEYGTNPQADHIYPVTKGGLSVIENMIYVCFLCNNRKSDSTLREFILQNKMDRDFIERNLELLCKKF